MKKIWQILFLFTWLVVIALLVWLAIALVNKGDVIQQQVINQYTTKGNGFSAYDIAKKNGFVGNEPEWIASLQGKDSVSNNTIIQKEVTVVEQVPIKGDNGQGAYALWLKLGNKGTENDFLLSLKGKDAKPVVQQIRFNADLNLFQTKLPSDTVWGIIPICGAMSGKVCN